MLQLLFLIPLAAGMAGIYLLLPQGRRRPFAVGVAAAVAGLVVGAVALLFPTGPSIPWQHDLLFLIFSGMAIASGVCMIVQRNPVYSALWFAIVVLSTCGLFLLQSAPFLAAATIIVYAGAIIVTFLFVIMLAQQTGMSTYDRLSREPLLACCGGGLLLASLLYVLIGAAGPGGVQAVQDRRQTLEAVAASLDQAHQALEGNEQSLEDVHRLLYPDPQHAVGVVLFQVTDHLPPAERQARRTDLEPLIGKLGQARMANDRGMMLQSVVQLREITAALHRRLHGTDLSSSSGAEDSVRALGRSMFTEYLWAVELAGTILLVATIGAVLIAGRRKEGVL
jgi:NADH-quinone oxidoreductase subunit J